MSEELCPGCPGDPNETCCKPELRVKVWMDKQKADMGDQKTEQKTQRDDSNTSETAEFWRDVKEARQEKRASNRENSAVILAEAGIPFVSKNIGAHLIVEGPVCFIDFWPGTGRWISRKGPKGFGVRNLIKHINAARTQEARHG